MALERPPQPLHFKAGAKQREQACDQYDAAAGRLQDVGVPAKLRQMPEDDNGEQCAAKNKTKNKTEAAKKQKHMVQDRSVAETGIGIYRTRTQNEICITQRTPTAIRSENVSYGSCAPGLTATCLNSGSYCQIKTIAPKIWIASSSR
jgi:hypothetical protein